MRRFAAGEAVHTPRGVVHQWRNTSDKPLRLLTTVVYDKGQPRVQLVPGPAEMSLRSGFDAASGVRSRGGFYFSST